MFTRAYEHSYINMSNIIVFSTKQAFLTTPEPLLNILEVIRIIMFVQPQTVLSINVEKDADS